MIPKSGNRFSEKIMREQNMIPKAGTDFPASAGEDRSEKIMREQKIIPEVGIE
jgi:hypothetical protein